MIEPDLDQQQNFERAIAVQKAHYRRRAEGSLDPAARLWAELMLDFVEPLTIWIANHGMNDQKGDVIRAMTCTAACLVAQAITVTKLKEPGEIATKKYAETLFVDELDRLLKQRAVKSD
jgi:hypothetical protein